MYLSRRHVVLNEEPPVTAQAALVLLNATLSEQERAEWTEFRLRLLRASTMTCEYCGKTGLTEELKVGKGFFLLGTLDHVVPVSKGGAVFDPANLKVACFPCNKSKAALSLDEWLARRKL
jgi:5-methylcytosine-specific restriction endonuclease McrA